ncbi:hypothetical protein M404DRAFT_1006323 [Pisolithus tinctorius Marx 270]|uniref:Uncharacterized protein n=1 Tax=Pisolithus tinctorius Marx 270 TaxID=870435 RepID=A0A0C3JHF8_PISTI|nr:hypothetical protein M404DRAFT_1006323 [Pisolithus tinctorius Marx 270]
MAMFVGTARVTEIVLSYLPHLLVSVFAAVRTETYRNVPARLEFMEPGMPSTDLYESNSTAIQPWKTTRH